MNSTTGEFCDTRKSLTDELYYRGTQSSAKRKPYVPRKVMNLRPLNINGIKKELEEGLEEEPEESQSVFVNCDRRALKISQINIAEVGENDTTRLKQTCEMGILKDISNNIETDRNNAEIETTDVINGTNDQLNINIKPEVKKNNLICEQKSNSFDFDFSVLSMSTPIKKTEINYVTPSANKLKVLKPESVKEQFEEFVTPKVNNIVYKTQCSLVKQSCLKTPINSYKNILYKTPSTCSTNSNNKYPSRDPSQSSPSATTEEELMNEEKQASVTSTLRDDKFNRIKVKNVEYIILDILGKGGSSEVFQCYNVNSSVDSQRLVAIKCVSLENSLSANSYINEVKLLQQLQKCDKIITMYDYEILESQKKLLVVLEKGGKDMSTILKQLASQRSHIPMYMLLFYWMEMLYAVKQIHSHGVIHSDLKPSNFLKADGGLKLIDFGIASSVQNDMTSVIKTTPEGSCNYISPEALNNDSSANAGTQNSNNPRYKLHYKSDVWSLGCILYQLVYRRTPFQHISQLWPKLATIMNPEHKIDYPDAQWVSPKIISTIKKCLQHNIKLRPSVEELIAEYETILHNV